MAAAPSTAEPDGPTWVVLGRAEGDVRAALLDATGREYARERVEASGFPSWVRVQESSWSPRWVWNDTPSWYGSLLAEGVRVARCHDLRLCHAILRDSALVTDAGRLRGGREWDAGPPAVPPPATPALFDLEPALGEDSTSGALPTSIEAALGEFSRQVGAIASATDVGRLRLLTAAESAGALIAEELRSAGLPWDASEHDRILVETLGERPAGGGQPALLADAATRVRDALGDPAVSLDSQPKLLRSLHRAGILVESTSRWELSEHEHPAIEPLLQYKKLSRLLAANGWAWLEEWVTDGRFRPVYIPGGVVTGRWASAGGGALQLPRQLRAAVRADPGWKLVVADVAQLEPRVLAAMSRDSALAHAARGRDLYLGIVESGAVATRQQAKMALLGAMYGATTGESGRLVPRLRQTYPAAMKLVDDAARVGEDGGVVSTWLGRTSPAPSAQWSAAQSRATEAEASGADEARARRSSRDRGRFTRNFIVQGTAAEWALAWLADLRNRLQAIPEVGAEDAAPRSGPVFARRPHLAFFLHDEVIVHTPARVAEQAADAVVAAADAAGRLLFGGFPLDFRLDVTIADTALKE